MSSSALKVRTFDELRRYVKSTLCNIGELDPDHFEMTENLVRRRKEPCGMHFCLYGPKRVMLSAVWETDRNTILFYGSNGERFERVRLIQAPRF